MQYFGMKAGAEGEEISVPVGEKCLHCEETFAGHDVGFAMPFLGAKVTVAYYHRECYLRQICGSAGHLLGLCSCHGGTLEEVPNMSIRQSAIEACRIFEMTHSLSHDWTKLQGRPVYEAGKWYLQLNGDIRGAILGPFFSPSEMCRAWLVEVRNAEENN